MKSLLKFLTCGSVDDGKSTLIGKLLYDANLLFADQKNKLEKNDADYSQLLDGLQAEKEQGITIDVAYRYFNTINRSYIVADTPGHEQYTRNMAVGASFASLALLLVNAKEGLKKQTYRHARICKMMGINYFLFAVNKMDLIDYNETIFNEIEKDIEDLAKQLELKHIKIIPVVATDGDNVVNKSNNMKWYKEETVLDYLENVVIEQNNDNGFIFPVQRVCRTKNYRGYQGEIASGSIRVDDEVTILPYNQKAIIKSIIRNFENVEEANVGMPISIELDKDIDVSRSDVIINSDNVFVSDRYSADVVWMSDELLSLNKSYYLKLASQMLPINIDEVLYKIDIESGKQKQAVKIKKNDIAHIRIISSWNTILADFNIHPSLGRFLLIDRISNETVAAGTISNPKDSSNNLTYQESEINREIRAKSLNQIPITIWTTGLSGSGKSALVSNLEKRLLALNKHAMILDGDNVRMGLNKDLSFSQEDRTENIRRIAEVSKLINDAGIIVLTSFISPFNIDRDVARKIIGQDSFIEVYVSTPLEVCEQRDVKGLYKKARSGVIKNFTGIDSPYEKPINPDIVIDMSSVTIEEACEAVVNLLLDKKIL